MSAPRKEEIEKILQRTIGGSYTVTGRMPIVDELWAQISEWIGDAQASEFEIGWKSGYEARKRDERERISRADP